MSEAKGRKKGDTQKARRGVPGWRVAFLVLCTAGLLFSADLERLHVNVHTDPDYQSYCAMSERVNCETVAASDFAVAAGLPTAIWGMLSYAVMGVLAIWGLRRERPTATWPFGILFWLGVVSSVAGLVLFVISHFVIHSVCLVCAATYLVNILLAGTAFLALRRDRVTPGDALRREIDAIRSRPARPMVLGVTIAVAILVLLTSVPPYWRASSRTGPEGLTVGTTMDAHPWIGARNPVVEIVEFSDYQCPHCRRGHDEMRALVQRHPDQVRLVHRNYPLDQACNPAVDRPFHTEACHYARLVWCAGQQDAFWEANDYVFEHGRRRNPVTSSELARVVEIDGGDLEACATGDRAERGVAEDLRAGRELGVRGTPTFVLDGEVYPGRVPAEVIDPLLRQAAAE